MKIGIQGYGRFGKLIASYLAEDFPVQIFRRTDALAESLSPNICFTTDLREFCRNEIIIPAVPISHFRAVLARMSQHIGPESLLVDVCSVKEKPVEWMLELLSPEVPILATHPMFGPDSAITSLEGKKIVLSKIRIDEQRYAAIKSYLVGRGLQVIEKTPAEHDEQIARSQLLTHFIGRALIELEAREQEIDTEGYHRLMKILEVVQNDSWELFHDMNVYNPYAQSIRENLIAALKKVEAQLQESPRKNG